MLDAASTDDELPPPDAAAARCARDPDRRHSLRAGGDRPRAPGPLGQRRSRPSHGHRGSGSKRLFHSQAMSNCPMSTARPASARRGQGLAGHLPRAPGGASRGGCFPLPRYRLDLHHPSHRPEGHRSLDASFGADRRCRCRPERRSCGRRLLTMLGLPLAFTIPAVLAALAVLPALYWLLRVTPPRPRQIPFPPLRLILDVKPREEKPARTPPWLLILRLAIAALVILAMAGPIWNPPQAMPGGKGPLLVLIDDGLLGRPELGHPGRCGRGTADRGRSQRAHGRHRDLVGRCARDPHVDGRPGAGPAACRQAGSGAARPVRGPAGGGELHGGACRCRHSLDRRRAGERGRPRIRRGAGAAGRITPAGRPRRGGDADRHHPCRQQAG